MNVEPSSPCQLVFGFCDPDHLAQEGISIQLQVKLALSEYLEEAAYTHMGGTVVGWWIDVE